MLSARQRAQSAERFAADDVRVKEVASAARHFFVFLLPCKRL
jgi:hypothetical protein